MGKLRNTGASILLISICSLLGAQPDEEYVNNLTKDINLNWLSTVTDLPVAEQLNWDFRQAPGFLEADKHARMQALMAEDWSFFAVDTFGNIAEGVPVKFPHKFEKKE